MNMSGGKYDLQKHPPRDRKRLTGQKQKQGCLSVFLEWITSYNCICSIKRTPSPFFTQLVDLALALYYCSHSMTKYLRSSFYGGELIGAHSLRVHSPSRKAWWQEQETADHMAITVRKQREMDAGALLFIQCV